MKRILLLLLTAAGLAVPRLFAADVVFFKGKTVDLSGGQKSLEQRFDAAESEFRDKEKGDFYLAAYSFMSRQRINGRREKSPVPFKIAIHDRRIEIRRSWTGERYDPGDDADEPRQAVVLFLHKMENGKSIPADLRIIDPEDTYEASDIPLYWLGDADIADSLGYLKSVFANGSLSLRKSLVFAVSAHDHPQAGEFLRTVASGDHDPELRKEAILFSVNRGKDDGAVRFLKDLYAKEKSREIKKQVVFALSLDKTDEAVREIIRLAKNESDAELRKNALFWLGQKASQEAVRTLKDIIDGDEAGELKKQALFAISQLPKDKSVPLLIEIAKTNNNPAVRKNAIFWLGQSGDERVVPFLEDILLGKKR